MNRKTHFVVRWGSGLEEGKVRAAIDTANKIQSFCYFEFIRDKLPEPGPGFLLANGGYSLDAALEGILAAAERGNRRRPLLVLTNLPYGDEESPSTPEEFFWSDFDTAFDEWVGVASTHFWTKYCSDAGLERYVLAVLGTVLLSSGRAGFGFHDEKRGCYYDFLSEPEEVLEVVSAGSMCRECELKFQQEIADGTLDLGRYIAARRLFGRASGNRSCFMAMPFRPELDSVLAAVRVELEASGWRVTRGDEVVFPRQVMDAVFQAIMSCDLLIADISGGSSNVLYELGVGHALGRDTIIIMAKGQEIPFNVRHNRVLMYENSEDGLSRLVHELRAQVASRRSGHI